MRTVALSLAINLAACVLPAAAVERVQELPNVPLDQPYTRTHRLWREAPNFQRVILRNRGHLPSYMAGMAPELYRDALTDVIVRNNPKK